MGVASSNHRCAGLYISLVSRPGPLEHWYTVQPCISSLDGSVGQLFEYFADLKVSAKKRWI